MANYIVPQVLINQLISEVQLNTIKNQNVLVIGPNYQLFRFSEADEKDKIFIGTYDGSTVTYDNVDAATIKDINSNLLSDNLQTVAGIIPYPSQVSASIPDSSYTKLYADSVVIELPVTGKIGSKKFSRFEKLEDDIAGADLDGRIRFNCALTGANRGYETKVNRVVTDETNDIWYETISFNKDESNDKIRLYDIKRDVNPGDAIRFVYTDEGGAEHVFLSSIVSVFESVNNSGIYDSVQLADTLPSAVVKKAVENNGIYEPEDSNKNGISLCAIFSDVEIKKKSNTRHIWNWDTFEDTEEGNLEDIYGIAIGSGMTTEYSNWGDTTDFAILSAKLYVEHRDLLTNAASEIDSIQSHALVENTLGTVHPDNPLAFGVYMAALNSGDRLVYYCGVKTNDLNGYNEVLQRASLSDEVYIICPTTMDKEVIQSVKGHVEEMSSAENKMWRIGFVALEPPTVDMIYDSTATNDGSDFYAKFVDSRKNPGVYNIVQFMNSSDSNDTTPNTYVSCLTDIRVGDVLRIYTENDDDDWDETPKYTERYVQKVISNTVIQLTEPIEVCSDEGDGGCTSDMLPSGYGVNHHYKVEVYRKLSASDQVKYIADQSSSLASRRMYNVFPTIASNAGVQFTGDFLACAAAGLVSSVLPQQPVTNVEINGVDDIPIVYQTYDRNQLNTIAAGGTFIIMQDRPGSKVYVRHQISTAYTDANLMKSELSVTKNLDSISYYLADVFASLIGKYNITPELISVIRSRLETALNDLENQTSAGMYGPQLLVDGTEIVYIKQSETNKDRIKARVKLNLPVPFNYFDLDLEI